MGDRPTRPLGLRLSGYLALTFAGFCLFFGCATEQDPFNPRPQQTLDLVKINPPDGAFGISPQTHVTLSFPLPMDPRTINRERVLLTESTPAFVEKRRLVPTTVLFDEPGNVVTIIPIDPLRPNTEYQILVQDLMSRSQVLFNALLATFTTGSQAEVNPAVVAIDPLPGEALVAVDSVIRIDFSKIMNRDSVLNALLLAPTVSGTVTFEDTTRTRLIFTPTVPLPPGQTVVVTVRPDAIDRNGFPLNALFVSQFFVEPPPRVLEQTVSPFPGQVGTGRTGAVVLEFSQVMNEDSVRRGFSLRFGSTILGAADGTFTFQTLTTDPFNPANISPPRTRITYTPTNALPAVTTLQIRVDGAAQSVKGLGVDPLFIESFTTGN